MSGGSDVIQGPREWMGEAGCRKREGSCGGESGGLRDELLVILGEGSQP